MLRRIYALFIRQIYLIRQSPPRLISYIFWPTVFMLVWGYLNQYLSHDSAVQKITLSTFLGANLFLSFMERSNVNMMMGFLEDVWSRNIGNILISPLRTWELIAGIIINGLIGTMIGMSSACLIAYLAFGYNFLAIGLPSIAFLVTLILTGWAVGLLILAFIFNFGLSAEFIGWMLAFLMTPFICVYYPVSVLPPFIQHIAWSLPPTYAFEGLRHWLDHHQFNWDYFYTGLALNGVWLLVGFTIFIRAMNKARDKGGLLSMSE
jgi:ABC-2 type transport system permease protein